LPEGTVKWFSNE